MERIIRKMNPIVLAIPKKTWVAAYARVSSGKDAMLHSLSEQVSYYSNYIQKHPGWEYIGTYADEAVTGTKDNRAEFQRLLLDYRAGKVDMVITKSISRFTRNTLTLLETVRELKVWILTSFFKRDYIYAGQQGWTVYHNYELLGARRNPEFIRKCYVGPEKTLRWW